MMKKWRRRFYSLLLTGVMMTTSVQNISAANLPASGPQIILGEEATDIEQYAARELQKYLYQLTGVTASIAEPAQIEEGDRFILGQSATNQLIAQAGQDGTMTLPQQEQGYALKTVESDSSSTLYIAGSDETGVLYGVYGLLDDHYDVGFYFGGETLPDEKAAFTLPKVDEQNAPEQKIRGILPWTNFPQSATSYSTEDWKWVIDTMSKMRMNLINIHNYSGACGHNEIYASWRHNDETSRVWNATASTGHGWGGPKWDISEYRFGAAELFDDYDFGTDATLYTDDLNNWETYQKGKIQFQQVIDYAHRRGVQISLGLELDSVPQDCDTPALDRDLLNARIDQVLEDYPTLDCLILYRGEQDYSDPAVEKAWNDMVIYAHDRIREKAPEMKIGISGWGLNGQSIKDLPDDLICAPIAAYSAGFANGEQYGEKEYWACPWTERDFNSSNWFYPVTMDLKETVEAYQNRSANTTGLMTLTWRLTGPIDPKMSYIAKAPWDREGRYQTAEDVYREYAEDHYGAGATKEIIQLLNGNEPTALAFECGGTPTLDGQYGAEFLRDFDNMETVDKAIADIKSALQNTTGSDKARLTLLLERMKGVKAMYTLDGKYPTMQWEDLPGAFADFAASFNRTVVDISSFGNVMSAQNRLIKERFVAKENELRNAQTVKAPTRVEARGTQTGAEITWSHEGSGITGYNVYRNGVKLNASPLNADSRKYTDTYNGDAEYTVTAIGGSESVKSIPSVCAAGTADSEGPQVIMVSPPQSVKAGQRFEVKARLLDGRTNSALSATLYVRTPGEDAFRAIPMERRTKAVFTAYLDAGSFTTAGIEYYIEAFDGTNKSVYPNAAPDVSAYCVVEGAVSAAPAAPQNVRAEGTRVKWNHADDVYAYRIYRDTKSDFTPSNRTLVTYLNGDLYSFADGEVGFDGMPLPDITYYKVTAVDREGNESAPSDAVMINRSVGGYLSFKAAAYDDMSGVQLVGEQVAYIENGDYIVFNDIDFTDVDQSVFSAMVAKDPGLSPIDSFVNVWVDGKDEASGGTKLGSLTVKPTANWSDYQLQTGTLDQSVTGIHTLYLVFTGDINALHNITAFSFGTKPGTGVDLQPFEGIEGIQFDQGNGPQAAGNVVGFITPGTYIGFSNVQFGNEVARRVLLTVGKAPDACMDDTRIEVWIDGVDAAAGGRKVGSTSIDYTDGWNDFRSTECAIEPVSGLHDIYLRFEGTAQEGRVYCFNFKSLQFLGAEDAHGLKNAQDANLLEGIKAADGYVTAGSDGYLRFDSLRFKSGANNQFSATVRRTAAHDAGESMMEIWAEGRTEAAGGRKLGTLNIPVGGEEFGRLTTSLTPVTGIYDLYLVCKGNGNNLFDLQSFEISNRTDAYADISAIDFYAQQGVQKSGNLLAYIENGDYAQYKNIDFGDRTPERFFVSAAKAPVAAQEANIEVWIDGKSAEDGGRKLATASIPGTADWYDFKTMLADLTDTTGITGQHDIYLVFTGGSGFLMNLSTFRFIPNYGVTNVTVSGPDGQEGKASVVVGRKAELTAASTPADIPGMSYSWQSDNTAVATVDDNGVVTGVAPGTANITATTGDGKTSGVCKVTVEERAVDHSALEAAVERGKSLDEDLYTAQSWSAYQAVLEEATAANVEGATQAALDEQKQKLAAAELALQYTVARPDLPVVVEAEDFRSNCGIVQGPSASADDVGGVLCEAGVDATQHATHSNGVSLPAGEYRVDVVMKLITQAASPSTRVANFDIYYRDAANAEKSSYLAIYAGDFEKLNTYQTFSLDFNLSEPVANLQSRLFFDGKASWKVDKFVFVRTGPETVTKKSTIWDTIKDAVAVKPDAYTEESYQALQTAIASAQGIYLNAAVTQPEIDQAVTDLTAAKTALEKKPIDKAALDTLVKECEALAEELYTAESYAPFKELLTAAQNLLEKPDAAQAEINKMITDLTAAKSSLIKRPTPVKPKDGWVKDDSGWLLYHNNVMLKGWQTVDNKRYYLGTDGVMRTGWYQVLGKWYFFESSGRMVTGWKKLGKWYYFGTDGAMRTGWYQVSGKWYFSESSGRMVTGWKKLDKWYYFGTDGAMRTGWYQVSGKWYFSESSGRMVTGWKKLGKWFFFAANGEMKTGWVQSNHRWYYLDQNGKMVTSTSRRIHNKTYLFNASGVCLNP